MKDFSYKSYVLAINELPNFNNNNKLYRGTSQVDADKWVRDAFSIEDLVDWFKSYVDNLYLYMTYEKLIRLWGSSYKRIDYKGRWLSISARKRAKDNRVVYLGEFCTKDFRKSKSIESIHYSKVISKFEKFVDEYCTDWTYYKSEGYKGYALVIKKERDKNNYFGTSYIHKNSTFKCISQSIKELISRFKTRIDQVIQYRTEATAINSKEKRIKQLQSEIAKLQQQIEEIKNEKETLIYKGIVLEYGTDKAIREGWLVGRIKDAPLEVEVFYASSVSDMRDYFEAYIDKLEKAYNIYCQLIGTKND